MQACTSHLSDCKKPTHRRLTGYIRFYSAAHVMRSRHHWNWRHLTIHAKLHQRLIDVGEMLFHEAFWLVRDIQINTCCTSLFDLLVNRSRHNITRCQRAPRIDFFRKILTLRIA